MRTSGLTWNDVVLEPQKSTVPTQAEVSSPPPEWRGIVAACLADHDRMGGKEIDFLTNLANWTNPPT